MPKFDYIIQNPPYLRTFHTKFFKLGYDLLKENGKMTIIEPATWLINVRKGGDVKRVYNDMKKHVEGHVSKVIIENYNNQFGTDFATPFSITYLDKSRTFDKIDFFCCGEYRQVDNLMDCNMVGPYDMIWRIFDKILAYGDTMSNHIYKPGKTKTDEKTHYCKYPEIIGNPYVQCYNNHTRINPIKCNYILPDKFCYQLCNKKFSLALVTPYYHISPNNNISDKILKQFSCVSHEETDKQAFCLYGTKEELENWKYNVFNTKLPAFLSICLIIGQHGNVKETMPWLVDKRYTDEEIYELFNIDEEEQKFIDKTLEKYERESPFYKRMFFGI